MQNENNLKVDSIESKIDNEKIWRMFSDSDISHLNGVDYEWLDILDNIAEHGPAKSLDMIFDYYEMKNKRFDSYVNFLLACSHFTTEELEGTPNNRAYRRRLEQKAIKLMKLRKKDPTTNINQFLYNNRNMNV